MKTEPLPPQTRTFKEVEEEMVESGYMPKAFDQIDTPIAQQTPCPEPCGEMREYHGYVLYTAGGERISYRAFAVCPEGHAQEF